MADPGEKRALPASILIGTIVAAVLGTALLLSGWLAWPTYKPGSHKNSLTKAAISSSGPIGASLNMFKLEVGRFPTTAEGLQSLVIKPDTLSDGEAANWHQYIEKPQWLRDVWNHPYNYRCPGEKNPIGYDLWSNGPDGQAGTGDDIGNWQQEHSR